MYISFAQLADFVYCKGCPVYSGALKDDDIHMTIVTMMQLIYSDSTATASHFILTGIFILQQRVSRGMLGYLPLTLNNPVSASIIENIPVFKQAKFSVWLEDRIHVAKHSL